MDTERSAVINIGGVDYELVLTTRATKEIAGRYGGLENLGDKLMKSENFEMAIDEIVWLISLLANQSILIYNLKHKDKPKDLLTAEEVELLTVPSDLAEYKSRITSDSESKVNNSDHPLSVGDMKFKDINGDGVIDQNDRVILGNGFPTLNYGITVGANYKNWDFNLYMYGVLGQDILSYSAMKMSSMGQLDDQTTPNILVESYDAAFRNGSGTLPRLSIGDYNRNYRVSDMWVKNGDFLRISNIQVGYTLPQHVANMLSIQKARVYVGVNNLFTISGYNKYGDPECGSGSVLFTGLDTGRYPMPRTFMAGVNVTF